MEFLRSGSSIPGTYWGCCAFCFIQNFKFDPADKSSIQIVNGDGAYPMKNAKNEELFAGPTYEDIFWQRLRYGTFGKDDMPNHGFLAVLTESQISGGHGKKWLAILKKAGFEFIRAVDNSVYSGQHVMGEDFDFDEDDCDDECEAPGESRNKNYLFGLFRNVGATYVSDPFLPPPEWTDLPEVVPEAWGYLNDYSKELAREQREAQLPLYNSLPKDAFLTEAELEAMGVPVTLAGIRSDFPQELKSVREARKSKGAAPTAVAPAFATAI
jgi:hypothetical protein